MNTTELRRLLAICEAATPGPWRIEDDPYLHVRSETHGCVFAADYQVGNAGEFIVEARWNFAAVLRELIEARALLAEVYYLDLSHEAPDLMRRIKATFGNEDDKPRGCGSVFGDLTP